MEAFLNLFVMTSLTLAVSSLWLRNLANLHLNGLPVGVTPNGAAIAAVYPAIEKIAVAYSDTTTANNATFQQTIRLTIVKTISLFAS